MLGKDLSRNSTVVLNYNDVTVQRGLTSDEYPVLIEAFSGPSLMTVSDAFVAANADAILNSPLMNRTKKSRWNTRKMALVWSRLNYNSVAS